MKDLYEHFKSILKPIIEQAIQETGNVENVEMEFDRAQDDLFLEILDKNYK